MHRPPSAALTRAADRREPAAAAAIAAAAGWTERQPRGFRDPLLLLLMTRSAFHVRSPTHESRGAATNEEGNEDLRRE